MKGVVPKLRLQIIADFYGRNVSKGKTYTFCHFRKMGCKKTTKKKTAQLLCSAVV